MGLEHFGGGEEAARSFLESPYLEGTDDNEGQLTERKFEDSEREQDELPYIFAAKEKSADSHAGSEITHTPALDSLLEKIKEKEDFAPSMEQQAEKIKDVYDSIPELQFDKWKTLDIEKRTKLLESFEEKIAGIEKRKPMPVRCETTRAGVMGYNNGYELVISERLVGSDQFNDYKEMLDTLFHEGRHSYQNHNLYIGRTEKSDELFQSWMANRKKLGYTSGTASFPFNLSESFREKSYYKYYTQPVEVDARLFAETVVNKIDLKER